MASGVQYVFAYGSLVGLVEGDGEAQLDAGSLTPAVLRGFRRTWNVAMDNSCRIPGYKRYLDPASGEPSGGFVVFLNIVADPRGRVNGALLPVSRARLAALDRRERNYERIEVSAHLPEVTPATVWTYAGSRAAVERFETGRRTNTAMISQAYRDGVRRGFATLGEQSAAQFEAWTDPPPCPVVPLRRVPVPGS